MDIGTSGRALFYFGIPFLTTIHDGLYENLSLIVSIKLLILATVNGSTSLAGFFNTHVARTQAQDLQTDKVPV